MVKFYNINKCNYILNKSIKLYLFPNLSIIIAKGPLGIARLYMPSYYFYDKNNKHFQFDLLFLKKEYFFAFLTSLKYIIKILTTYFFLKLRIRGLGYRIDEITSSLYRFYFTQTNYFYFHVPPFLLLRNKGRRIILISNKFSLLRNVYVHLLHLRKIIPYLMRFVVSPRRLIVLKPGKKAF